jgi:hypothetical protein
MPDFSWDDEKAPTASAAKPASGGGAFSWDDVKDPAFKTQQAADRANTETQFEKDREQPAAGTTLGRTAGGAWSAIKAMNPFSGAPKTDQEKSAFVSQALSPWKMLGPAGEMAHSAVSGYGAARDKGEGVLQSMGAGVGSAAGLDVPGIEERSRKGDIAGVVGEALPAIGATLVGGAAKRAPELRSMAREALTTPEGELKPMVHAGAHAVGGAVGGGVGTTFGHPEMGAYAGYRAGPGILKAVLGERSPAPEFRPMGTTTPEEFKNPVVSKEPFTLKTEEARQEEPKQSGFTFPPEEKPAAQPYNAEPIKRMGELLQQQGGAPPGGIPRLDPNVALREQRQLQKPFGNRAAVEVSDMAGPRTVAPEKVPQAIPNMVDQAMGADVTPEATEKARLQEKYPDAGDRQQIHRTSEQVFEATRDNPKLRKALGDLPAHDNKGGPDLARAAANLGEDLGQQRIGNKKAEWMGAGQVGRSEMFDRLLAKGHTPQQIYDAAQAAPPDTRPGLMRSMGSAENRGTGTAQ